MRISDWSSDVCSSDLPHPVGERHKLDTANDGSAYSTSHARFHPWLREFLEARGYYDVFLISAKGDVVYTVFKESDFATNLETGEWKDSGRSEERREGKECVGTCRFRGSP